MYTILNSHFIYRAKCLYLMTKTYFVLKFQILFNSLFIWIHDLLARLFDNFSKFILLRPIDSDCPVLDTTSLIEYVLMEWWNLVEWLGFGDCKVLAFHKVAFGKCIQSSSPPRSEKKNFFKSASAGSFQLSEQAASFAPATLIYSPD